ncbi:MAG TPA: hypothetical protein VGP57_06395 [Actinoplanes sp.]|nr:hypothetical protein [Actinoplanes sp.]
MTRSRHLPTALLVLVTTALVALGLAWWVDSAPEPLSVASAGPASNIVVIQLDNGAVLTYDTGDSGYFSNASQQVSGLERIVSTQWPCRVSQPGARRPGRGGLDFLTEDSPRVIRLPRCAGTSALNK